MASQYLPAGERRALIVETVVALAGKRNPSEITTAEIASHMNVTQGALFRHFSTKDSIWQAVMEWVSGRLLARIDCAVETAASPVEALQAAFMSHIAFVIEHPGVPRMMFGELQRAEATPAKKAAHALMKCYAMRISNRLEAAKSAGEISKDTDTDAAAILFLGTIQGLVMQAMMSGSLQALKVNAPAVLRLYLRGIGARNLDILCPDIKPSRRQKP